MKVSTKLFSETFGPLALCLGSLLAFAPSLADDAPQFEFHAPSSADDAGTQALMRDLAERILPVYEDADQDRYLLNLAALQLVAGDAEAAWRTRQTLKERHGADDAGRLDAGSVYDLYAHARSIEAAESVPFDQAFSRAFHERVAPLDDHDAYALASWLGLSPAPYQEALRKAFDSLRAVQNLSLPQAIDLIGAYVSAEAYRQFSPLVGALVAEEDTRRYIVEADVLIRKYPGRDLYAHVVRPKRASQPMTALLEFTFEDSPDSAKASAAHGYAGVVAYVRVNGRHSRLVPFEHEGEAARAAIAWIVKQDWSDGRVGMLGEGYGGFAAWAAAKHPPAALKAIATANSMAPGIDFPDAGRVFRNSALSWALRRASPHAPSKPDAASDDDARWRALDRKWYASGKPYRDLDRLATKPSRAFRRWLNHPSYDRYWQKLIPDRKQFARLEIPVLTIAGDYAAGETGALYYFSRHTRYRPTADHSLLIGPYNDGAMRNGLVATVEGYAVDPVARIDLGELRYQWFDSVLKGGAKPSLLQDRVNVEVAGANQWRHAPSLEALADGALRFYLTPTPDGRSLAPGRLSAAGFIPQTVDFADRSDADWVPPTELVGKSLLLHYGISFVSEPLTQPLELGGLLSGRLDFRLNKMDVDLNLVLYELSPDGTYLQLAEPYEFRASYARDRARRHLLRAGARQQLAFTSERMTSRKLEAGSRLVLVLGVNKRPDREINYGSGKDVGEESIADAGKPLSLRWYGSSYVDLPVRK